MRRATFAVFEKLRNLTISIHALREEGDQPVHGLHAGAHGFLSTPSARRATRAFHSTVPGLRYFYPRPPRGGRQSCPHSRLQRLGISIHALREEGDLHPGDVDWPPVISIHALREEGDNFRPGTLKKYQAISIHALREEGDISQRLCFPVRLLFLSTPSARRATDDSQPDDETKGISIHALREEGDSKNRDKISIFKQIIQHSARI